MNRSLPRGTSPEPDDALLIGKRIAGVEWVNEDRYMVLRFDDGTAIEISGLGYDGLWDDVGWSWVPEDRA